MSEPAVAILRGLALAEEPRSLAKPGLRPVPTQPVLAQPAPEPPPSRFDPAEIEHLREAAFREGYERGMASGLEEGRARGFEQGQAEGRQAAEAAVLQQVRATQERLALMSERLEQWLALLPDHFQEQLTARLRAGEDDMVALCHAVICRILGERALSSDAVIQGVRAAVGQFADAQGAALLAIHVHPQDLALLQADPALSEWLGRLCAGPIPWRPDEAVQLGGCIVRSNQGGLDARLETQLAALQELLLDGRTAQPEGQG